MARNLLLGTALQTALTFMAALAAPPADAQPLPNARPTGGSVVAGAAAISQTPNNTQINQSSQRAAIDWKSFDVGSKQSVTFSQPSASAVALNRVTGPDPSQIAGRIDANGQIILINQSGVNFYKGAQVNAAGVMVSTIGASDQSVKSFVASNTGKLVLDQPGDPNAKVDNQANITLKQAGLAAFVAPQVANSGTITAKLGHVVLAGAKTATLDLYGDGLLSLDVTNQVTQAPAGATALVTNTGVIIADGGTVQLTARAADGIVQNLVQAGGTISAASIGNQTGVVALNGVGGSIVVEGQLSAPGSAPGTTGGAIVANATGNVTLTPTAMLNAAGQAGGGTVAVGTTLARAAGGPGVASTLTAANVVVQKGATIWADATGKGKGGRVTVLSTKATALAGSISAKGGPQGGDGGFVETSGDTLTLAPSVTVDTRAPRGLTGMWQRDPTNWTIANSGGDETPAQVVKALESSNVTTTADNDLTVKDPINATGDAIATNSLIFQAGRTIAINAGITLNGGSFAATANDSVDLGTNLPDRGAGPGAFTMAGGVTIDTSVGGRSITIAVGPSAANTGGGGDFLPGTITLVNLTTTGGGEIASSGGTGLVLNGNVNAGTGSGAGFVTLSSVGAITEQSTASVDASLLVASTSSPGGNISLPSSKNMIFESGGITATNGDVVLVDGQDLTLAGTHSGNNLFFEVMANNGTLTFGDFTFEIGRAVLTAATNGRISLVADNYRIIVSKPASSITAVSGTLELSPYSNINTSVNGSFASNQLLIGPSQQLGRSILSIIAPGLNTLRIGGFTDIPNGGTSSAPRASSVTIDGPLDLIALATTLDLEAIGSVTQSASAPITNVGTLLGTTGSADLSTAANQVSTLGGFSASNGPFALNDSGLAGNLTVNGPVTGTSVTIENAPTISVAGRIGAGTQVTIMSGADGIGVGTGGIITGPTIDLNGAAGGIALGGNASVGQTGGVVDLTASGVGVSEAGTSTIIAGTLQSSGNVAGPVTLANGNTVASIGAFMVTGAGNSFTLVDAPGVNLGVSGPLGAPQDVVLSASGSGAIAATGSIGAGRTLSVTSGSGGISLGTGAVLTGPTIDLNGAAGGIALNSNASVGQPGGLVDLTTTASGVTEAATATVTAGTLRSTGGITGDVVMAGAGNVIAALGSLAVSGGTFSLTDTGNLNVAGKLTASDITIGDAGMLTVSNSLIATGTASLTAASIDVPGLVSGGSVTLSGTAGPIDETGSLIAGTLSGSAIGAASLTGVNQVTALGNFSAGSFTLDDSTDLLIEGTLNAARIAILDPVSGIALGDSATIITGGMVRPPGAIQPALEPANGGPGALLRSASFAQIGSSTVVGQGGGPATLQISTTGNTQFDPPLGLAATGTWLILNLTTGTAAGSVFVNALDVTYTGPGSTNLFGTIDGVIGGRAASLGFIQPAINVNYLFNRCVIEAAECTTVSLNTGLTATLGAIYPLLAIRPPSLTNLPDLVLIALPMLQPPPPQLTDPDVVPPNITYLDY